MGITSDGVQAIADTSGPDKWLAEGISINLVNSNDTNFEIKLDSELHATAGENHFSVKITS